jgi:hypothetical protein
MATPTTSSTTKMPPEPRRPARPAWGPEALQSLRGRCYRLVIKEYEYSICPGINVTQRQTSQTWNSFWGILGIFETWTTNADAAPDILSYENEDMTFTNFAETFQREQYTDGTDCGGAHGQKRRNATVEYMCSGAGGGYALKNVTETTTCEYLLLLACPEACRANWLVSGTEPQQKIAPEQTPIISLTTTSTVPTSTPTITPSTTPTSTPSTTQTKTTSTSTSTQTQNISPTMTAATAMSSPTSSPTSSQSSSSSQSMLLKDLRNSKTLSTKINELKMQIDSTTKNLQNLSGQLQDALLEVESFQ